MLQLMNFTCAKIFLPIVTKRVPSIIAGFFVSAKTLKTTLGLGSYNEVVCIIWAI